MTRNHPIELLRHLEAGHRNIEVNLVSYSGKKPDGPDEDGNYDEEVRHIETLPSVLVTPEWLDVACSGLDTDEYLGLNDRMTMDGKEVFIPMVDFIGLNPPIIPEGLIPWFGGIPFWFFRTNKSWHLYGSKPQGAEHFNLFYSTVLANESSALFNVDSRWRCMAIKRGYATLRWSAKEGGYPVAG